MKQERKKYIYVPLTSPDLLLPTDDTSIDDKLVVTPWAPGMICFSKFCAQS